MSSNIVVVARYKKDDNFFRLIGGWCNYVSKDGADTLPLKDLSSIENYYLKEFGIYDNNLEHTEYHIWNKNGNVTKQEILKDISKNKAGKMWNLVISFPPKFALDNGLNTKEDYYLMTKSIMPRFLLDNDFDLTNTQWYASLHRDTDNPHLHITIFETEPKRIKDTLEKNSIKYLKSYLASYLIDNTQFYKEQDYLFLGLENKIRKSNFTKTEKQLFFSNAFRKSLNKNLLELYKKLPSRGRLQYNSKNLNYCRKDIDKIIEKILYHDTIKYEFERYYHSLESIEREQKKMYGENSNNNYVNNKIKKLYSKIGNDILYNYKVYNSIEFLEKQKMFLKNNILGMEFKSKCPKKNSTILKHAKELYQLGKLAELSEHDIKKLLKKWCKKSNINCDIDILYNAVSIGKEDLNATNFFKALSHLGYTQERYNNLKSKSFYKRLRFKQFINNANYYLIEENRKEEEYLKEILEKELQNKNF